MTDWLDIESAPKNGTWILAEGEMMGGDTSSIMIARWNPKTFRIGEQDIEYEWEHMWEDNWYANGRVRYWMPLPKAPTDNTR